MAKNDDEFDREYEEQRKRIEEAHADAEQSLVEFERQWEQNLKRWDQEQNLWDAEDQEMSAMARDFFQAITNGDWNDQAKMDQLIVRTVARFERFLDWHEESSKLWRNGYIDNGLQLQISNQFTPDQLENWRLNLMEDTATPDEVLALQVHMMQVSEHAAFLVEHIQQQTAENVQHHTHIMQLDHTQ